MKTVALCGKIEVNDSFSKTFELKCFQTLCRSLTFKVRKKRIAVDYFDDFDSGSLIKLFIL